MADLKPKIVGKGAASKTGRGARRTVGNLAAYDGLEEAPGSAVTNDMDAKEEEDMQCVVHGETIKSLHISMEEPGTALQETNIKQQQTNAALLQQTQTRQQNSLAMFASLASAKEAEDRTSEADEKALPELMQHLAVCNKTGKNNPKHGKEKRGKAQETCPAGGTNENKPKMNGGVGPASQLKIDKFLSPTKPPSGRPPLQEENSSEAHKKDEAEIKTVAETELKRKGTEPKETEGSVSDSTPTQTQTVIETQKKLPPTDKKPESQRKAKAKPNRRKEQATKSPNRKVTDYFPVRRSNRKSKKELECEEKQRVNDLITGGTEEGMKIDNVPGKGRGVITTRDFHRGEFVVEYHGDLIEITDAKQREAEYAQDSTTGCYMYYFQYLNKTYCVDATKETGRLGRLINHSKNGNCHTKLHDINNVPHLILIASRDIKAGEELLYDYGDRSRSSIEAHPWLKL
ncbi:N-lysine methyltransferase KMT5A [Hyperolius riggenbachi]|uniref:N-lysine methyltransferase KMT5A n=1 Tax=Hyperolius riggenbachi TaxID=752182 RepID=UPI0035A327DB